jgi:hypothetical protein
MPPSSGSAAPEQHRVYPHPAARQLDAEIPAQLHDAGLGGRVRHLGGRRPDPGQERRGVDDRAAGRVGVAQVRDAVLAGRTSQKA